MSFVDQIRALAAQGPKQEVKQVTRDGGKLNVDRLVVLRMGLGRDSMTMLVLLAQGLTTACS